MDKTSGGSVTRTVTYYPVAGAMRINSTLYYILKDHLGSASVVTDASGVTVGEQRYYPYGETRLTTGTIYTDKLFTGQREITGLGIYDYGARFYSPKLGRFLSPDTIVPGAANPQAYNRYSYVLGNPLKYIDPSGHGQCQTKEDCADMGTTPMGTGGSGGGTTGGGGGGGGGGNHDDDDIDPNPKGLPAPCDPPGNLVCQLQQGGYVDSAEETWTPIVEYVEDNLAQSWSAATEYFESPIAGFGQFFDPYLCQNCGQAIDYRVQVFSFMRQVAKGLANLWTSRPTQPLFPTPLPSLTPVPTATITPYYTPTVTSTVTPSATPWPTLTSTLIWTPSITPTSPYITPTYSRP